jgi:hypothetical protein
MSEWMAEWELQQSRTYSTEDGRISTQKSTKARCEVDGRGVIGLQTCEFQAEGPNSLNLEGTNDVKALAEKSKCGDVVEDKRTDDKITPARKPAIEIKSDRESQAGYVDDDAESDDSDCEEYGANGEDDVDPEEEFDDDAQRRRRRRRR